MVNLIEHGALLGALSYRAFDEHTENPNKTYLGASYILRCIKLVN